MNNDKKILKGLEVLQDGQKAVQSEVSTIKDVQQGQGGKLEGLLEVQQKQGKQLEGLLDVQQKQGTQIERQGKLLSGLADTLGTVLAEQHAQRLDIRSLHTEVHAAKDELKAEMLSARAEAKADSMDVKAVVMRSIRDHEQRIDALEDAVDIPHPADVRRHLLNSLLI